MCVQVCVFVGISVCEDVAFAFRSDCRCHHFHTFSWIFRSVVFSLSRAFLPPHPLCYVCSLNTSTLLMFFSFSLAFLFHFLFCERITYCFPHLWEFSQQLLDFNGVFCTVLSFVIKEVEVKLRLSDKFTQLSGVFSIARRLYAHVLVKTNL